jgi:hypothetical protein
MLTRWVPAGRAAGGELAARRARASSRDPQLTGLKPTAEEPWAVRALRRRQVT